MFTVTRGNRTLGKILGYASDMARTKAAAVAKFGAGVAVRRG
jgi:hypothetical protein